MLPQMESNHHLQIQNLPHYRYAIGKFAEAKGFEPLRRCRLPVFKTGAIDQLCQTSNIVTRERLELPTPTFVASCSDPTELTSQCAEAEGFEPSEPFGPAR